MSHGQLELARGRFHAFVSASGLAAAWSFDFSSSFEQAAWRVSAVLLVVVPVYSTVLVSFFLSLHFHRKGIYFLNYHVSNRDR